MCALCGVLGGNDHWADAAVRPGVYTRAVDPVSRRRERANRVRIANHVLSLFGLTLSDWQGRSYLLSTRTGKTEIVEDLAHLWAVAERLTGHPCDPLAEEIIARLERSHG